MDDRRQKVQNSKEEDREMLLPGMVLFFPRKLQGVHWTDERGEAWKQEKRIWK